MKKALLIMLILLFMGLWGCGKQEMPAEEAEVMETQSQPAAESTEATEPAAPTERVETYNDEKGNTVVVSINPDGSRTETYNHPDGSMTSIHDNPETGEHIEAKFNKNWVRIHVTSYNPKTDRYSNVEYYENGNMKRADVREPSAGFTSEQEYYENGNMKQSKVRAPDDEMDAQYNEEGYCTYYHHFYYLANGSPYEIECFGDETGKLVKVIENGEETDDAMLFGRCIRDCNFRQ